MQDLRRSLLPLSGASYLAAWVVGLVVSSSSTQVHSTGAQVQLSYAGHSVAVTTQFILTEGVTGMALSVVLWHLAARVDGRLGAVIRLSGLTASAISLGQSGIGVLVATRLSSHHDVLAAGTAFDILTRLDGVKMLVLAVSAGATAVATHRARVMLPSWLAVVSLATTATIAVSGAGYLALDSTLAAFAYASLPLLVGFVTGTSACLSRSAEDGIGSGGGRRHQQEGTRHGIDPFTAARGHGSSVARDSAS